MGLGAVPEAFTNTRLFLQLNSTSSDGVDLFLSLYNLIDI